MVVVVDKEVEFHSIHNNNHNSNNSNNMGERLLPVLRHCRNPMFIRPNDRNHNQYSNNSNIFSTEVGPCPLLQVVRPL